MGVSHLRFFKILDFSSEQDFTTIALAVAISYTYRELFVMQDREFPKLDYQKWF